MLLATNNSNQPPPLVDYNPFDADRPLVEGLRREGAAASEARTRELGALAGSAEWIERGFEANAHPPVLRTHDRYGERLDEVVFHPSWHALMRVATSFGLHAAPWRAPGEGAHVARAAQFYLWSQVEAGHGCPISMTHAAIPALRKAPGLAAVWEPKLLALDYEPRLAPIDRKASALCGMAMTERQGGSDVRANTTRAEPAGDGSYAIVGHKWFCSAPMSDAFLVLAQAPGGLSCFLLPRMLADGAKNAIAIERLKDKLGNRSNASSEVRFDGALAHPVGEEGRGVVTIIEMVNHTRLDCIIGSAALMRAALAQAVHHARYRSAFGAALLEQPLMQNVLADLALESEAATAFMLRIARACDRAERDPHEAHVKRLGTALGKYWICKRASAVVGEALEVLGGNGYVEESVMPRLFRESPLNSIWEGAGNVNALDVLRALGRAPQLVDAYLREAENPKEIAQRLRGEIPERDARSVVEGMILAWQAALLRANAPAEVAESFVASRLEGKWGRTFGTLGGKTPFGAILERALPTGIS
ncbi:MAG: acyl-CoA dehydrogenase family protein [Candidatus Eremiobacteraeota bacterium]|nr:acyl-CoA dehydrogenase family protein [Candidatus Eremiobacteraeota bacterium]